MCDNCTAVEVIECKPQQCPEGFQRVEFILEIDCDECKHEKKDKHDKDDCKHEKKDKHDKDGCEKKKKKKKCKKEKKDCDCGKYH